VAKAWEVPGLERRTSFREAAGRVILTRWREMMSYREGTLLGEDIEELHAMRVSSRRLRAAMDAFAEGFPGKSFRAHLREVKGVTDTLGRARDLDVAIERLQRLVPELEPEERPGIHGLIARYAEERTQEGENVAALFARLDEERFAERFEGYVERHTGIAVRKLKPRAPAEG
jgi:CHAD domain-containing protein